MKIIVDIRNYAHFEYEEYLDGGSPETNPYVLGQVTVESKGRSMGGQLGHIFDADVLSFDRRRVVFLDGLLHDLVQPGGGNAPAPVLIYLNG